jgi:hypothetical protein
LSTANNTATSAAERATWEVEDSGEDDILG